MTVVVRWSLGPVLLLHPSPTKKPNRTTNSHFYFEQKKTRQCSYSAAQLWRSPPYLDGELDVLVHSPALPTSATGGVVPPCSAAGGVRVASSGGHGLVVSFGFFMVKLRPQSY